MKITSSPLQIVAVVAAVTTLPLILADRVAAGGVSTNTEITLLNASHVVVPVLLMVIRLKKVSVVNRVVMDGV